MTSKLIVNELAADTGISTITVGDNMSGVTFKTGTSNLHNVGIEIAGINVLGADTPIGVGATIYNSGDVLVGGAVTATKFYGDGSALTGITDQTVTINNQADNRVITGTGATNTLNGEASLTYDALEVHVNNASPKLKLTDTDNSGVFHLKNVGGVGIITTTDATIFETAGSERLRINSNGSIQVTPEGSTSNPYMLIDTSGDSVRFNAQKASGNNEFRFLTQSSGTVAERLRITSAGKFGFNDDNPERTIDVKGSNCMIQLEGTGGSGRQYSLCSTDDVTGAAVGSAGQFVIYDDTSGTARLNITSDGKFGLNTTAPYAYDTTATTFEVKGSVASAADTEVARFRGGSDADGGTAVLRLTNENDRGLVVKGGRESSSSEFAEFGVSSFNGTYTRALKINASGKVAIGATTTADRDLEVFNTGSQTAIGIKGGTNTSQCSLWFMKPTDGNIGGIYYTHGSTNTQGMYFRVNDQQIADIKGTGILRVTNTIAGAGHTAAVHIFKASGNDADHAELAVGYDSDNCYAITRRRNSGDIEINTRQSGSNIQHEYRGTTRWTESASGMINTYAAGSANFIGRWRYCQTNQSQNYEHHILGPDGQKLFPDYCDNNTHGIVWVGVVGTGTGNAYCQYRFSNKSALNNLSLTHIAGGSAANSNVPYIVANGHNPAWKMDHPGTYTMVIDVMVTGGKSSNGTYSTDSIRGANP